MAAPSGTNFKAFSAEPQNQLLEIPLNLPISSRRYRSCAHTPAWECKVINAAIANAAITNATINHSLVNSKVMGMH